MHPLTTTRSIAALSLVFLAVLGTGCAHQQQAAPPGERLAADYPEAGQLSLDERVVATGLDQPRHDVMPDIYADGEGADIEVVRGSRYALVAAEPSLQQRELLEQIVTISIPPTLNPSVEDGIRYTLQHTGYGLCAPRGEPQELLYSRPLPAAHFRLGPMPLREALQVLGGRAFEIQADPIARMICYQVRDQRRLVGGQ